MFRIGLTGNRYSGKDRVARLFQQITIPVFHADIVLKFILNHNFEIQQEIKSKIGTGIFTPQDKFDVNIISYCGGFSKIVDIAENELFKAYERFEQKNKQSIYTIFHSSILFERGWKSKMDMCISVFSPKTERTERCKYLNPNMPIQDIWTAMSTEMSDLDKNNLSEYVIHNYPEQIFGDTLTQVSKIDQKIIDKYLQQEYKHKLVI